MPTEVHGLDISLTRTGLCLPNGDTVPIETGGARLGDRRLYDLARAYRYYLRSHPCKLAVLEAPSVINNKSRGAAPTTGIILAQGAVRTVLAEFRVPVALIELHTLKTFAVGKGNADKQEMILAANQAQFTEALDTEQSVSVITDDDCADAWWLRQMGLYWLGESKLPALGQVDTDGRDVRWRAVHGPWKKTPGAKWPGR